MEDQVINIQDEITKKHINDVIASMRRRDAPEIDPAEVTREVALAMDPDDKAVEQATFGAESYIEGLGPANVCGPAARQ